MSEIFIAKYEDGMYPEDNFILGCCKSHAKAQSLIADEISRHSKYPEMHRAKSWYYSIDEFELIDE